MLRILLIILLFPVLTLQAQQIPTVDQYFPSPPNAASLAKYSEIPVDKFSGTSNISIPIYTLTEGDLSVPISLNYHTGGLKVTEVASWAGLGWALSAGGSITRQVNGSIDEGGYDAAGGDITEGWYLNGNNFSDDFIEVDNRTNNTLINNNCNSEDIPQSDIQLKRELSEDISRGIKDTEPDVFYLNIPGYNGKFFFNEQQEIIFDPFQNIEVEVFHTPGSNDNVDYSWFTGFVVTTPDGTKYSFGNDTDALDRSFSFPHSGDVLMSDQIVNTWHLTSIKSLNDDYQINFEYEKQFFYNYSFSGTSVTNTEVFNSDDYENRLTVTATEEARLSRISSTHSEVLFTPKNEVRKDILSKSDLQGYLQVLVDFEDSDIPRLLDKIEVNTNGDCIAKFKMNHEYFTNGNNHLPHFQNIINYTVNNAQKRDFAQRRPKLASLVQTSCGSDSDETFTHVFSYKSAFGSDGDDPYNLLPSRLSFQQDHWGYYTNSDPFGIFPKLNMIPEAVIQANGNYPVPLSFNVSSSQNDYASDRSANEQFSGALSLKGITYPTGAQQILVTEGNAISRNQFAFNFQESLTSSSSSCFEECSSLCQAERAEFTNLSLPGPVVDNNSITYSALIAKIYVGDFCPARQVDEYQGFLVVERIDPGGTKTVFSEHINLSTSIGEETTRAFGLGLTEKVRIVESPACWWNPNEEYNIYFYKGANESDINRQQDPIILTLEIKTISTGILNTIDYPVGGRRIASISEVEDLNTSYTTSYSYSDESGNNSSGVILDFPKYVFFDRVRVPIQCNIDPPYEFSYLYNKGNCVSSDFIFRSTPVLPLTSTIGSSIGYRVVSKSKTGGVNIGKTVSTFVTDCVGNEENHYPASWYSFTPKKKVFPKVSKLIGKMVNEKQYSGNSGVIMETNFEYKEKDFANGDGFYSHRPRFAPDGVIIGACSEEVGLYYFKETLPSSYVQLTEKIETLDGLTTTTQYDYREDKEHINPTEIRVYRNGGLLQTTHNYYPQDILENPDPHLAPGNMNNMLARNMTNVMVKSESSGLETKGMKNVLALRQNRLLPIKTYAKEKEEWVVQSSLIYSNDDPFPDKFKLKSNEKNILLTWHTPFSEPNGGLLEKQKYLNHIVSFTYDNDRKLRSRTEIDNQKTEYFYDGFNRLETVLAYGASGGLKSTTTNTYNIDNTGNDNYILNSVVYPGTPGNPGERSLDTKNSYRPSGLLDYTTRLNYSPTLQDVVTDTYQYDEFKRLESSTNYQTGQTDFTYYPDPLNRTETITNSDGSIQSFEYGSDQMLLSTKKVIDENGNESIAYTDLLGRPKYNDRLLNSQPVRTAYDYFPFGALEKVTTPTGKEYNYTYDDLGRLITKQVPGQNPISYTYDPFYRIETMTDGNQVLQSYQYDFYNRNIRTYVDGTLISRNFYDKGNSAGIYRGKVWKTRNKMVEPTGFGPLLTTEITYDEFGRTETEDIQNHIGGNDITNYTYDYFDNILTANKVHTGHSTNLAVNSTYHYDLSFRMLTEDIKVNNEPFIRLKDNIYNEKDQLVTTSMFGKNFNVLQVVDYDYNSRGWLTKINDVDDNGIPLVACSKGGGTPCTNCPKDYTAAKSQSSSTAFAIIDAYGGGGKLIPLEYPYPSNQLNKFKNDLKSWLNEMEFNFGEVNVSWENGLFQISTQGSVFEMNSLNIIDAAGNKSEILFTLPNAEEFIESENEYCNLCQQFGYDCATCPAWELLTACDNCPVIDQQVLDSLDCENCDIGGYGVLPKQLSLKLNPELFATSENQIIHWDVAAILYLKDGEGTGLHPAGTYITGNPLNAVADQSDVYISFQLPEVIIARDNQVELENYIAGKFYDELKQLFVDVELFDEIMADRLQALATTVIGEMMDKMSPFAKKNIDEINTAKITPL